ncbi:unnamed protein product [Orchesella dallaii]|uniref:Uncharacterized protein n=1 Tax=Orchesella dallaii TaxID=48710 RepID=A0ABP1RJV3_9HEXA
MIDDQFEMNSQQLKSLEKYFDTEFDPCQTQNVPIHEVKLLRNQFIKQLEEIVRLAGKYYKTDAYNINERSTCPFAIRWKQNQVITYLLCPPNRLGLRMDWHERYHQLLPQLMNIVSLKKELKIYQRDVYLEEFLKVVEEVCAYGENLLLLPFEDALEHAKMVCAFNEKVGREERESVNKTIIVTLEAEGKVSDALAIQHSIFLAKRFVELAETHNVKENGTLGYRFKLRLFKWFWPSMYRLRTKQNMTVH